MVVVGGGGGAAGSWRGNIVDIEQTSLSGEGLQGLGVGVL